MENKDVQNFIITKSLQNDIINFLINLKCHDLTVGQINIVSTFIKSLASLPAIETTILATPETTDKHVLGEIIATIDASAIGAGAGVSSVLLCSLARTGGHGDDTYNSKNVYLVAADFHFEIDTVGSRTESGK